MIARWIARSASAALLCAAGAAQCTNPWLPGDPLAGPNGDVTAMVEWDPDGVGPLPRAVVAGGDFTVAGAFATNALALYDPAAASWSPLGGGLAGAFQGKVQVHALAVLPNNDLVVAGQFLQAGGVPVANIARWNGSAWASFASGLDGIVLALTALPNGDVVAGGDFVLPDGSGVARIARWNGTTWAPLGAGVNARVRALATMPNGDVVAGGDFTLAGTVTAAFVARWDGTAWWPLPGGALNGSVLALLPLPGGELVAAGAFANAGGSGVGSIGRWNGTAWAAFRTGMVGTVHALALTANGDLVAGGSFGTAGGTSVSSVARWNGSAWSAFGAGLGSVVQALAELPGGDLLAGGSFGAPLPAKCARWNGTGWVAPSTGTDGTIAALAVAPNGDVIAGGAFRSVGGVAASRVARRSGTQWSALGNGVDGPVEAVVVLPNGDVVVGGWFATGSGVAMSRVGRWNGTAWSPLGPGLVGIVRALAALPNGDVVALDTAGGVQRWNGTVWSSMGLADQSSPAFPVRAATAPNGDLFVGGTFTVGGQQTHIARWSGTVWAAVPSPGIAMQPGALAVAPNGDLWAAWGTGNGCLRRWDGTAWTVVPGAAVFAPAIESLALAVTPGGDVVLGGSLLAVHGVPVHRLARWDGSAWSPLGSGIDRRVMAVAVLPNGDLAIGGHFTTAGGAVSASFAQLTTTCPASAIVYGTGCSGSGGANVLAATALPWLGGTFAARATGMPGNGLAVRVLGFAPLAVPLAAVLPQGVPGCSLLAFPDVLDAYVPTGGVLDTQLAIPDALPLVGTVVRTQVAALELGGGGAIVALTSTNALVATIGSF